MSLSEELATALALLAARRATPRSPLVEMLLRENPLVRAEIENLRAGPETKKGRSIDKLLLLGKMAEQEWERRVGSGQIKIRRPGE